uniref:Putative ixodes 10 kDa peptide protein n=1 Tax=Ixodes ricinus TaxID=34613 RepID=A0A0K8RCH5_IXORI
MLHVLFVVVLILPVFEAAATFFMLDPDFSCFKIIETAGDLFCQFQGHNSRVGNYSYDCEVECDGNHRVRLPKEVCSKIGEDVSLDKKFSPSETVEGSGKHMCNKDAEEKLNKWKDDLEKRKDSLMTKWCRDYKGK